MNMMSNELMAIAIKYAEDALKRNEVPIGCVFAYNGKVIASGSNEVNKTKNATRHAELVCIDMILAYCSDNNLESKLIFEEGTMIVTVEPCIMCSAALCELNIKKIIYGCSNDRFGGHTNNINIFQLLNPTIDIESTVNESEALQLLQTFYKSENPSAPKTKKTKKRN